jgi:hypothetical protein
MFILLKKNKKKSWKGAWLLVDGGYLKWRELQCPGRPDDDDSAAWVAMFEVCAMYGRGMCALYSLTVCVCAVCAVCAVCRESSM